MHIWALTYFEEVGHITECCYFDAMNFFWSDYCSPKWELEVQHSGHMWVQCLPMGTKWQCMPMGMKVQHSRHMSAMRLKFPFSMFQRLNQHRSHGPIFASYRPPSGNLSSDSCRGGHKLRNEYSNIKIGQVLGSEMRKM